MVHLNSIVCTHVEWKNGFLYGGLLLSPLIFFHMLKEPKEKFIADVYCVSDSIKAKLQLILENRPYRPPFYSKFDWHGQLQTVAQFILRASTRVIQSLIPFSTTGYVKFERELVPLSDGGLIALDWATINSLTDAHWDGSSVVVINHGLGGGSNSDYIVHLAEKLILARYRVVVVIARGCCGLNITTPSFVMRKTSDMREALLKVTSRLQHPGKIFMVGFSLGGALSLKYLCEEGARCTITAAVCISPPWRMDKRTGVHGTWSKGIMLLLKAYIYRHRKLLASTKVSIRDVLSTSSIDDLEGIFSEAYGYSSLAEYYADNSPINFALHDIHTPTLTVSSLDDPVCCGHVGPSSLCGEKIGPGLCVVKTSRGGHCSFPNGLLPSRATWTDQVIVDWFDLHND